MFYRGADCCILVGDLSSAKSFDSLEGWREEFLVQSNVREEDRSTFPFIVVGNKCDLPSRVSKGKIQAWCEECHDIPFFETSCKDPKSIDIIFQEIAKQALAQASTKPPLNKFLPVSTPQQKVNVSLATPWEKESVVGVVMDGCAGQICLGHR